MDVTVRLLDEASAPLLARVAPDVFDEAVEPRWLAEFLADPRHHMVLAVADGVVVGMASAVHYVHPDKAPQLWINEVGVASTHRGRGIGRRLLEALLEHARHLGCREAWLGTEPENVAARRLYAAAGGREAPMVMVSFDLDREDA